MNDRRQFRLRVPMGTMCPKMSFLGSRRLSNCGYLSNSPWPWNEQNGLGAEVADYYGEEDGILPRNFKKAKTNSEWQVKHFGQSSNVDEGSILRPKPHTDCESAEKREIWKESTAGAAKFALQIERHDL